MNPVPLGLTLIAVFAATLALRLAILDAAPGVGPDSRSFTELADNLIRNHCYSHSDLSQGSCVPSWGSQPPGYPLFIAIIRAVGGGALAVTRTQAVIFALAVTYAVWACYLWHKHLGILIASGAVLALSPLSLSWPRWELTETLASAAVLWVFAELFRSIVVKRLRLASLCVAIFAAALIRWDQIWCVVPAALCAAYLGGIANAVRCSTLVVVAAVLPALAMMGRAAAVGLPLLPPVINDSDISKGTVEFWRKSAVTQYATSRFLWPIWSRNYTKIAERFDYGSIDPAMDTPEFRLLLVRIGKLQSNVPLPPDIEKELSALAQAGNGMGMLELVSRRVSAMWTRLDENSFSGWGASASRVEIEQVVRIYRIGLLLLLLLLLLPARGEEVLLIVCTLSYVIFRTLFLASLAMLETRYLMEPFPAIELVTSTLFLRISCRLAGRLSSERPLAHR